MTDFELSRAALSVALAGFTVSVIAAAIKQKWRQEAVMFAVVAWGSTFIAASALAVALVSDPSGAPQPGAPIGRLASR